MDDFLKNFCQHKLFHGIRIFFIRSYFALVNSDKEFKYFVFWQKGGALCLNKNFYLTAEKYNLSEFLQ